MNNKVVVLCLFMFLLCAGADWRYPPANEPNTWDRYSNCKNGSFQSPININKKDTEYAKFHIETNVSRNGLFEVELYKNATLRYTTLPTGKEGETFTKLDWLQGEGSILDSSQFYDLHHFEIHWNQDSSKGSEHGMEGEFGAAEIQFYYYNVVKGRSYEELKGVADGIVVQAYILKVGNKLDLSPLFKFSLDTLKVNKVELELDLSNIVPLDFDSKIYNYAGSITYPPCEENVQWLIVSDPIDITEEQLEKLKSLRNEIISNVRPQRESTGRRVFRSFDKENTAIALISTFPMLTLASTLLVLFLMI